jgi:putative ABC transport system permease protein
MDQLRRDIRYAIRAMRRDAGFCAVAVLILGIGIGANTAIFSVVNTVLFRPLPFREPERLVWIANATPSIGLSGVTSRVSNYRDLRALNRSFEDLTAYFAFSDYGSYTLGEAGEPERLIGYGVAQNFFDVLGVRPMLGRPFDAEECAWNGRKAVILGHGLWQRRFGSDPGIVGRSISLNGTPTLVVGVLPETFDFASVFTPGAKVDMLTPFAIADQTDRWGNTLAIIGRLKPGGSVRRAQAEFDLLVAQLQKAHPERGQRWGARLTDLQEQISGRFHKALIVLLCAVGAVLLIACANLSNLLLARAASRRKEIAVRIALGASRGRLIRLMLTESLLLSGCGAIAGLALAFGLTRVLAGLQAMSIPMLAAARIDGAALGFTLAVAVATGVLFGLAPALQLSGADLNESIKENSRGSSEGRRGAWVRSTLVIGEVALACVLLVGAGLLMRSFVRVMDVDLGFQPGRTAVWTIEPGSKYRSDAQRLALFQELVRRVEAAPGVESAGLTDCLPLGRNRSWGLGAKGVRYPEGQYPTAFPRLIDEGYIPAMKIPLKSGRTFTQRDTAQSEKVVILNENAARALWPGRDAVGQIALAGPGEARVIGVVANVRHSSLEQDAGFEMYFPLAQMTPGSVELVVRARRPAEAVAPDIRTAMRAVEPSLPTAEFRTLDDVIDRAVSPRRFVVVLLGGFAVLALALASLGIYGLVSYSVAQRTQEIGIRMALGASSGHVQLRVLRETVLLALAGAGVGIVASIGAARMIESLLYGVQPGDAMTFAGMLGVLTVVAALAGYLPARRASRIDPMVALRAE